MYSLLELLLSKTAGKMPGWLKSVQPILRIKCPVSQVECPFLAGSWQFSGTFTSFFLSFMELHSSLNFLFYFLLFFFFFFYLCSNSCFILVSLAIIISHSLPRHYSHVPFSSWLVRGPGKPTWTFLLAVILSKFKVQLIFSYSSSAHVGPQMPRISSIRASNTSTNDYLIVPVTFIHLKEKTLVGNNHFIMIIVSMGPEFR